MRRDDHYRVAIKPSAWRRSSTAGEWVNGHGSTRTFPSKALAREWASECSTPKTRVWVQDAVPWDGSDVDGYLVATGSGTDSDGPAPGRQSTFER